MKKILAGIVAFFSMNAVASTVYVQSDIFVSGEGKTVQEAQTNAVTQGQQQAFLSLMKKIAPNILEEELSEIDPVLFVQDVSLSNEKVTAMTYKGNLTVRFKADPIYDLLKEKNVSFLSSLPEPMLFVPVFEENNTQLVFNSLNPILSYFETEKPVFDFFPLKKIPFDEEKLSQADQVWQEGLFEKNASFLNEYEVSRVLVFYVKKTGDLYEVKTKVLPQNSSPEAEVDFQVMDDRESLLVMKDLVKDTFSEMQKKWIYLMTKNVAPIDVYYILTPVTKISELKKIKDKINQLTFAEKIEIKGFKNKMLMVEFSFKGTPEELKQKLLLNKMLLEPYQISDETDTYLLTFTEGILPAVVNTFEETNLTEELPQEATQQSTQF